MFLPALIQYARMLGVYHCTTLFKFSSELLPLFDRNQGDISKQLQMQISFRMHFGSNFSWIHKVWILLILSKPFVCLSFCLFVLSFSPEMLDGYFLILGMNLRNYNDCCKKTCPQRFYKFFEKLPEGTL